VVSGKPCILVDRALLVLGPAVSAIGRRIAEGAERVAHLSFAGGYEPGPAVYHDLQHWMIDSEVRATGPLRNRCLRFGADRCGLFTQQVESVRRPCYCRVSRSGRETCARN
jgi:hypothetical protein